MALLYPLNPPKLPSLDNFWWSRSLLLISFSSSLFITRTPKRKTKKSATPQISRKCGKQKRRRKVQPPPELPPPEMEASSANSEEKPSLRSMMCILVDISSRLSVTEQRVETLATKRDVPKPSSCRGSTQYQQSGRTK